MKYCNICGFNSSKIILGTDGFGERTDEKTAFEIMDAYAYNGGNHLDSARLYAGGRSEEIVGRWLKGKNRADFFVATKGAHPRIETMNIPRLSLAEIESDADKSLAALGVDEIDLYWLHRDCESVDVGGIVESLNTLIKKGKIKAIGASNWRSERIAAANAYAKQHNLQGFTAGQIRFSPASTAPDFVGDTTLVEMNAKEFEFYKNEEITAVGFASQAKGFFSKYISGGEDNLSPKAKERYFCAENIRKAQTVKNLSEKYSVSAAAIVCAAMTSVDTANVMPIIGSKNAEQLNDSMSSSDLVLTPEEVRSLIEYV